MIHYYEYEYVYYDFVAVNGRMEKVDFSERGIVAATSYTEAMENIAADYIGSSDRKPIISLVQLDIGADGHTVVLEGAEGYSYESALKKKEEGEF